MWTQLLRGKHVVYIQSGTEELTSGLRRTNPVPIGFELTRPIEKLYPLKVSDESNVHSNKNTDKETVIDKQRRPVRLAAQKATQRIKEQSEWTA